MASKFVFASTGSWLEAGGTKYWLTSLTYNEAFDKIDATSTDTSGDGKEYLPGRAERTFSAEIIMNASGSDITLNSQTPITASFEGKRYLGLGTLYTKAINGSLDDVIKAQYEGSFDGAVTIKTASQA